MERSNIRSVSYIAVSAIFVVLITIGAFIKIPIPYVPLTLQVMFVNLAALILNKRYALLATLSYMLLGLVGVPVFASGGGFQYIFNPTFGYIIGFVLGAFFASFYLDKFGRDSFKNYVVATIINLVIIYSVGVFYLYLILNIYKGGSLGFMNFLSIGFLPFILGDIITCALSIMVSKKVNHILKKTVFM